MHKLSELIGREIVNIDSATSYGTLINLAVNGSQITHIITDGMDFLPNTALSIGEIIATAAAIDCDNTDSRLLTRIGGSVIDTAGNVLGLITDYELSNSMQIARIITNKQNYTTTKMLSFSGDYIVIDRKKATARKTIATSASSSGSESSVSNICDNYIINATICATAPTDDYLCNVDNFTNKSNANNSYDRINNVSNSANIEQPNITSNYIISETSAQTHTVVSDYSFLIGRRVSRDIHSKEGKRLICANSIINTEIVTRARIYNKLVELALYSEMLRARQQ